MMHPASDALGAWMSAALDDPAVCDEMKADIRAWFDAGQPATSPWRPDREAVARIIDRWANWTPGSFSYLVDEAIDRRNRALRRADAILALGSPEPSQPPSGGVELEALKRAAMVWADKADPCPADQEHIGLRQLDSLCMAARAYAASVEQGMA